MNRPPLRSGRDTSPFRALALETADADSRAPNGLKLRSRPSDRARDREPLSNKRLSMMTTKIAVTFNEERFSAGLIYRHSASLPATIELQGVR